MTLLISLIQFGGYVALPLTIWSAMAGARRHRDLRRLDILLLIVTLGFVSQLLRALFGQGLPAAAVYLLPFLHLRLVQHFRTVPSMVLVATFSTGLAGVALRGLAPLPMQPWQTYTLSGYLITCLVAIAITFVVESRRSAGVTARRLLFAALGATALAAVHAVAVGTSVLGISSEQAGQINTTLSGAALVAYYLAFATPRALRRRWQRRELGRYLVQTADRDAEDRSVHAAADLLVAAQRGAAGAFVFVAVQDAMSSDVVTVRASSAPGMAGTSLDAEAGPADMTYREAESAIVGIAQIDPVLRPYLSTAGSSVLLAPISTSARRWGVVGVVQRHGSLFPRDDLRLLEQLAAYAGGILDHGQLVTEARERAQRAADRRLREVESRLSLMLDTITDYAILMIDHKGHVVNWPVGAGAVFGYTEADVRDRSAAPLLGLDEAEFQKRLDLAARHGVLSIELEGVRPDGSRFQASTTIRRLEPGPDDLQGFVLVARDVSERRALEERLRQGQKMEALGRMAGGIAHDFNNLLTAIIGYADWLQMEMPPEDTTRLDQIGEIQKAATHAAGLTRQLLAFSRHQIVQPVVLDIARTVGEFTPILRRLIGEQVDLADEVVGHVPPVLADRNQIEQVVINLAVNARDAMPKGGRIRIRTSTQTIEPGHALGLDLAPGDWVTLSVADTGVGMDAATVARIFEPFFTTKESGRGTGLGLATVYGIVRQMGGHILVESAPGVGSTFTCYLRPTKLSAVEPGLVADAVAPRGSESVLLVEDDPGVAKLLFQTLQRHGYSLLLADGPAKALELTADPNQRVDLVITDVVLPGGSGPDLVRALRQTRPDLSALFISGYATGALADAGLPPNAQFLQKPFGSVDLLLAIRRIVSGHR